MPAFKLASLLIFFAAFLGICAWLVFGSRSFFTSAARMPLDDDKPVEPREEQ